MAKVRIPVIGTVGKAVRVDPNATNGARLGTNVFLPNGDVGSPATIRSYLGITGTGGAATEHRDLGGLRVGDDHPQYTMWQAAERITGQWQFEKAVWGMNGTAAAPSFSFTNDTDTGVYRVGANNIGVATAGVLRWDANADRTWQVIPHFIHNNLGLFVKNEFNQGAGVWIRTSGASPDGTDGEVGWVEETQSQAGLIMTHGFRIFLDGPLPGESYLRMYRHHISATPAEVWNIQRSTGITEYSVAVRFAAGSASVPSISFVGDPNTGMYSTGTDEIGWTAGGTLRMQLRASGTQSGLALSDRIHVSGGTATAPAYTFTTSTDTNTGMYRAAENQLGFTTDGTQRLLISTTSFTASIPWQGVSGSAGSPAFSFSGDPNTGMYSGGADILAFGTAGNMRFGLGAAGELLDGSGNPGAAGEVPTSAGTGAAWTWGAGGGGGGGGVAYVNTSVPAGNTVANTVTETAFTSSYTISANQLQDGSVVRLKLFGVFGTDAVAPTLRVRVKLGATTVLDTSATTLTAALTNQGWMLEGSLVCFTDGATGTLDAQGIAEFATGAASGQLVNMENTSTSSVDTTSALALTVTVEWGAADADNTITLREMVVELFDTVSPDAAAPADATYLTENDETADLPNSRRLLPGTNVTFDDTVPGERTVNATGGGGGSLSFVTETTLGADATDITVSSLDLDADEKYFIEILVQRTASGASSTLSCFFNGDTTATNYERGILTNAGFAAADNANFASLTASSYARFEAWLCRGISGNPMLNIQGTKIESGSVSTHYGGVYWDTSANVTSITINSSVATGFLAGSRVRIWKLTS